MNPRDERDITGCFVEGLQEAVDEGVTSPDAEMFITYGAAVDAVPSGLPDISISFSDVRHMREDYGPYAIHGPHANIECKRVAGRNARLCRRYVVCGVDRFRYGTYARSHSHGFMVAYLVAGKLSDAVGGINSYISDRTERIGGSTLLRPWLLQSRHIRADQAPIVLHHSFFGLGGAAPTA